MRDTISLSHGNGGYHMRTLIRDMFSRKFGTSLAMDYDSAVLTVSERIAVTTDTFTVKPLFFNGGDIGKLAVCGTVNDLVVSGAQPNYLTCALVIEEGFSIAELGRIIDSMASEAKANDVSIVTGDTKVVPKHEADGIFINTTGIGVFNDAPIRGVMKEGDAIIVTGDIGRHGAAILAHREGHRLSTTLASDAASLLPLMNVLSPFRNSIRVMHDPTRGGLAQTIHEFITASGTGVTLESDAIPIAEPVRGICELFGFDALYLACEGRAVMAVDADAADEIVSSLRKHPLGREAARIGTATPEKKLLMTMPYGVRRQIEELGETPLPRIC
mgnify:CR=1 FL=1